MTPGNWWAQRAPREKQLLVGAAVLIVAAALWWSGIAPALRTLQHFENTRAAQSASLQSMRALQAQAQTLQAQTPITAVAAAQALKAATDKAFGTQADLSVNNGSATVNLRNVSPEALAQWLAAARSSARATPLQARLTQAKGAWSGSIQLALAAN